MDDGAPSGLRTLLAVAVHVTAYLAIGSSFAMPDLCLPIFGIPVACAFIWGTVRLSNRRDDPRHAKVRPGAP
jgi:hypothetical protein